MYAADTAGEVRLSVRFGLLALLDAAPSHGYNLKTAFERRTGGCWARHTGQVYTTIQRLERDSLVLEAHHQTRGPEARPIPTEVPALVLGSSARSGCAHLHVAGVPSLILRREDHAGVPPDRLTIRPTEQPF